MNAEHIDTINIEERQTYSARPEESQAKQAHIERADAQVRQAINPLKAESAISPGAIILIEDICRAVISGNAVKAIELVRKALDEKIPAEEIVQNGMIRAMTEIGQKYKDGATDIPRLLLSARAMQKSMSLLEPVINRNGSFYTGTVVIGTVEGDLHEIGKNLVAVMFRGSGFRVIDLGVDVSEKQFLKALKDYPAASFVCISSLLTTSFPQMRKTVNAIRRADKKHKITIMVGGGPVTQKFADEIGADLYTEDAVEAAAAARRLMMTGGKTCI